MGEDPEYQVATDSETSAQRDARIAEIEAQKEENDERTPDDPIPNIMADDTLYHAIGASLHDAEHIAAQAADMILETEELTTTAQIHAADDEEMPDAEVHHEWLPMFASLDGVAGPAPGDDGPVVQPLTIDEPAAAGYEPDAMVDPVFAVLDGALGALEVGEPQEVGGGASISLVIHAPLAGEPQDIDPSMLAFDKSFDIEFAQGAAQEPPPPTTDSNDDDAHAPVDGGYDYSELEIAGAGAAPPSPEGG